MKVYHLHLVQERLDYRQYKSSSGHRRLEDIEIYIEISGPFFATLDNA